MLVNEAFNVSIPDETREKLVQKADSDLKKIQLCNPDAHNLSVLLYNNYLIGIYIGLNSCKYFEIKEEDMNKVVESIPPDINSNITHQVVTLARCLLTESDVTSWQTGIYGAYINGIILGYNLKRMKDLLKSIIRTT